MFQLRENHGWELSRRLLRFTLSTLRASEVHAPLARPGAKLLDQWDTITAERRRADDVLVDCNARVSWLNVRLDGRLTGFIAQTLADCDGKREHPTFRALFPDAPGELVRLGLESEVEALRALTPRVEGAELSKAARSRWAEVTALFPEADESLRAREEATLNATRVSLKVRRWKEDANALRRSIAAALDQYAVANGLPATYRAAFFPPNPAKRAGGAEDEPADDTDPSDDKPAG